LKSTPLKRDYGARGTILRWLGLDLKTVGGVMFKKLSATEKNVGSEGGPRKKSFPD